MREVPLYTAVAAYFGAVVSGARAIFSSNVDGFVPHTPHVNFRIGCPHPLSSEYGTCKTVKARFWPWLSG